MALVKKNANRVIREMRDVLAADAAWTYTRVIVDDGVARGESITIESGLTDDEVRIMWAFITEPKSR
jgi:hypothetical protein